MFAAMRLNAIFSIDRPLRKQANTSIAQNHAYSANTAA
jgi:hypothetical protein